MNTLEFLSKVLPTTGFIYIATLAAKPSKKGVRYFTHYPYPALEIADAVDKVAELNAKGEDVYFACSTFKEVLFKEVKPDFTIMVGRTQENVQAVKSFWLDLDVGKDDPAKCYPTQREAANALVHLVKSVGLPPPMIVSSGAGLHAYWPLTTEMPALMWASVAGQLKSVCAALGVKADPSRTSDSASVLRPIGTINRKHNKPVKLLKDAAPVSIDAIAVKLTDYILNNHVAHSNRVAPLKTKSLNSLLAGTPTEYPPSDAEKIVEKCAVMAHFKNSQGNVREPFWRAALGILKHCVNGNEIAHEWSSGHKDYTRESCQNKIDGWTTPPATCIQLATESGLNLCGTCKFSKTCKSPITLGYFVAPSKELTVKVETESATDSVDDIKLPDGYSWMNGMLHRAVPDKDGVVQHEPFCDTLFYATSRIRDADNEWALNIRMNVAGYDWREFELPTCLIPDPRGLAKHLAAREIIIFGITHAMHFLKAYTSKLQIQRKQSVTYSRFGWDDKYKFIVGTHAFCPSGDVEQVIITDNVVNSGKGKRTETKGDLDTWIALMDKAYNRPKAEKFQFAIAAAFASPLVPLMDFDNYRGIPIVLSGESGCGKSSVCEAACTIYGAPATMKINAGKEGGSTLNGLFSLASMFNGVPLLFDEITERDPKDFIPLMYTLSNGICKIRMTGSGQFAETAPPFAGITYGTSNKNVTDMIYNDDNKDVSDAASSRCFEIGGLTLVEMELIFGDTNMKDLLEHQLFEHQGMAAQVYIPYIIKHKDAIRAKIVALRTRLGSDVTANSRERFYIDTIVFVHIASVIAHKLGLIKWNVKATTNWAISHLKSLRRNFFERTALADDNASRFLSWLHGRTIISRNFPIGKPKGDEVEVVGHHLRFAPVARIATVDKKMFVTTAALHTWCHEYKQIPQKIREQLIRENYIVKESVEFIGKGTDVSPGRARVFELDYSKVSGMLSTESGGTAHEGE